VGKKAISFTAPTMDRKTVKFPSDCEGKLVLLDFWATWCPPCREELPGLAKAYEKHHASGFEILGITLDNANAEGKIKKMMADNKMTWPQVYDGKGWKAAVAQKYDIHSIPAAFLIDGDTGEIVAMGNSLRGEELDATLTRALKAKAETKKEEPAKAGKPAKSKAPAKEPATPDEAQPEPKKK
jgi:thiol-disulfide isomerase/thioredoxin